MSVSSSKTNPVGIVVAVCLAFCLAFATGTLGINAFLVQGAEGGSTGSTIVTFVAAAVTWLFVVPFAVVSCIRPRSKILHTSYILTPLGLIFGLWLGTAIGWTINPRNPYRYLYYCEGPSFYYLTFLTSCDYYKAILALNWCAWGSTVLPYLGLTFLSLRESRQGNRHVWTTPIFEYPWMRSSQQSDQMWKEMPDTRRGSSVSGGRPGERPIEASSNVI